MLILFSGLMLAGLILGQAGNSATDDYHYARRLFDEGYYDLAAEQLKRLLRDHPGMLDADEAQFLLGESYLKAGNPQQARAAFLKVAIVFPESPRAPESLLKVGFAYEQLGQLDKAAQAYARIEGFYPQSQAASTGLQNAMRLFSSTGDLSQAEAVADKLIDKYPLADAADFARFSKALWIRELGQEERSLLLFQRLASRTENDSLASAAWVQAGSILENLREYNSAIAAYQAAMQISSNEYISGTAKISLANLMVLLGRSDEAIVLLKPLLDSDNSEQANLASMLTGDAFFRKGDFSEAYRCYIKPGGIIPSSMIKAGWAAEKMQDAGAALEHYLTAANDSSPSASSARLRAAWLSKSAGKYQAAFDLFYDVLLDTCFADSLGFINLELAKLIDMHPLKTEISINDIYEDLIWKTGTSPFEDEIFYLACKASGRTGQHRETIALYEKLITKYPASEFADSARIAIRWLKANKIQSSDLMSRMAELSSMSSASVNPVDWAIIWGDFYLYEFKDLVKAIDQYDKVLGGVLATTDQQKHALYHSGYAYLRLYETALVEGDSVSIEMYGDSTRSRIRELDHFTAGFDTTKNLKLSALVTEIRAAAGDLMRLPGLIDSVQSVYDRYLPENIPPELAVEFLEAGLVTSLIDSSNYKRWLAIADKALEQARDDNLTACLQYDIVQILQLAELPDSALHAAERIIETQKPTAGTAKAEWWLINNPLVQPAERLKRLDEFKSKYHYLPDPEISADLTASLLREADRVLESMDFVRIAKRMASWSVPELDILSLPGDAELYDLGNACLSAGNLERSELEYRTLINVSPAGNFTAGALLGLVRIKIITANHQEALAWLTTLDSRFPYSKEADEADHLRPWVEFSVGDFNQARQGFIGLTKTDSDADSAFYHAQMAVVCLYRLNQLDDARSSAKQLYREFDDRDDIDDAKALFYLEKGKSLDRQRKHEDARKQYSVILKKYMTTPSADAADYAQGLSFVTQGSLEEGISQLARFIENHPRSDLIPKAKLSLGLSLINLEKFNEAMSTLRQTWSDSSCIGVWHDVFIALDQIYRDMNFWDAAISLTREYLQRYPDAPDALDRNMDVGQFYLQMAQWDEAIRYYKPLLVKADAEREAEIQYYIGEAYMNRGDYQTAILEFLKVPTLGRKTKLDWGVTALYQVGIGYEKLGNPEGAARMYRRIIRETGATSNYGRAAQKRLAALNLPDKSGE